MLIRDEDPVGCMRVVDCLPAAPAPTRVQTPPQRLELFLEPLNRVSTGRRCVVIDESKSNGVEVHVPPSVVHGCPLAVLTAAPQCC